MIGVDTNIILCLVVGDDPKQLTIVEKFREEAHKRGDTLYLNLTVVVETVWALAQIYKYPKASICQILEHYLTATGAEVEAPYLVKEAIELYRASKADFSDCLILARNQNAGVSETKTFDKNAAQLTGYSLLK